LDKVKYSYATWIKGTSGEASLKQVVKFLTDIKTEMKEHGVMDLPLGTDFIDFKVLKASQKVGVEIVDGTSVMHETRAIKNPG
jgi:Xaa-Pro aminopeptidase